MRQPSDLWDLGLFLAKRRTQVDQQFDYRSSVLIFVFGNLLRQGKLKEEDLEGLSENKLVAIRRFAEP